MGGCAGCAGPKRINREQLKKTQRQKPLKMTAGMEDEQRLTSKKLNYPSNQLIRQTTHISFSRKNEQAAPESQPGKSRSISRTVLKYKKPTTIQQEEQQSKENISNIVFSNFASMPKKTINEDSLEKPIEPAEQPEPGFFESPSPSEIKEIMSPNSFVTLFTPSPQVQVHQDDSQLHLKQKRERKQHDLEMIEQLFKQETETPAYIRGMKKNNGEDIRMDNYEQFGAIPQLQWIQLNKYLTQLEP